MHRHVYEWINVVKRGGEGHVLLQLFCLDITRIFHGVSLGLASRFANCFSRSSLAAT